MAELNVKAEIERRRTFAIISHPDAGKTTLTEKLIYHGGVIREAGEVRGKAGTKAATSDWMKLEQERGISVTSSVIQFDYHSLRVNLLDTPGHKDFSEDTYRTLIAADSAVMLIDVAKGVEERTKKLYEVCRYRQMPIFTFINKCDREGKVPLELMSEIEETLQMKCFPITWPLGLGGLFGGLYDRLRKQVLPYKGRDVSTGQDIFLDPIPVEDGYNDPRWKEWLHPTIYDEVIEELRLLDEAIEEFDHQAYMEGKVSPTTFGSAKMNFAVDRFLEYFVDWAPAPQERAQKNGAGVVNPLDPGFTGFVFKIQANMDRKHRDRIAFIRVCSGVFERGMKVQHQRLGRELRLAYSSQFVAQERETADIAFAGDIVGVNDSGHFQVGDAISSGRSVEFEDIPRFTPELFGRLTVPDAMKRKKLQKAIQELSEEGMIQVFTDPAIGMQDPILGVVGELQFSVLLYRLEDEYGLDAKLQRLPFTVARWPRLPSGELTDQVKGARIIYRDTGDRPVILLEKEWDLRWLERENEAITFGTSFSDWVVD